MPILKIVIGHMTSTQLHVHPTIGRGRESRDLGQDRASLVNLGMKWHLGDYRSNPNESPPQMLNIYCVGHYCHRNADIRGTM